MYDTIMGLLVGNQDHTPDRVASRLELFEGGFGVG
jgi:hypothetical protein